MSASAPLMDSDETVSPSSDFGQGVIDLMHAVRDVAHDQLELATLETRLTVNRLLTMAAIAVIMAVLLVTAWLAVVAVVLLGLIEVGLTPASAFLLVIPANLLLAAVCWIMMRKICDKLGWPSTLRALVGGESQEARNSSMQ